MSHDIWRINTGDVLVEASVLVVGSLRAGTLASRGLVATVTTDSLGGDGLHGSEDVRCWSSLRADHLRPTINHHIREGSQGILIA
jgi:hypothetical protein